MGNFKNESVQTLNEQKVNKVNNSINVCKGGTLKNIIEKIENYYFRIDDDNRILLELNELDINIDDEEQTEREIYLKQYYDINDDKERISTMNFIERELNFIYIELRELQKQLEQFFPKTISWEEDEDNNEDGVVRGDEELVLYKFIYDDDIDLDQLSENKSSDNELILYNYYKVNESLPIEIVISFTELLEQFDNSIDFQTIILEIIKSKI
jgi:hypothetical protein